MTEFRSRVLVALVAALVVLGVAVGVRRVSAQGPDLIPKKGDGYDITPEDTETKAPEGFEGRTDTSTQTAVGNTPATLGKKVVTKFVMSNQIRTCPTAAGEAEGEGLFSFTIDSTSVQAAGTSTSHVEMRAKAKYKGQVNDDAYLNGPVKAEIDYTYIVSGSTRGANGALVTPVGTNIVDHITVPFLVEKGLKTGPSFGAFSGGDPTHGRLGEAYTVGAALAYWGGIYYSVAQEQWRSRGKCIDLSYTPPSKTVQPALGTQVKVKALVKTKRGESVPAKFVEVHAHEGAVVPLQGKTTDESPALTFTYTAPNQKPGSGGVGGFTAGVTSRAGITEIDWDAKLGTNWSGQISCMRMNSMGPYSSEQTSASSYFVTRIDIEAIDGVAHATGYSETNASETTLRPVARQGYEFDASSRSNGIAASSRNNGAVRVSVSPNGTYSINADYPPFGTGTIRSETCSRNNGCREQEDKYYIQSCFTGLGGTTGDPNRLHGEYSESKTEPIGNHSATQAWSYSWDLARQGTTK